MVLAAEDAADELDDVLHVPADVVEHHRYKKEPDDQEAALENILSRARAECASLDRLGDVEDDLPSIEYGNRKKIEDGDVAK